MTLQEITDLIVAVEKKYGDEGASSYCHKCESTKPIADFYPSTPHRCKACHSKIPRTLVAVTCVDCGCAGTVRKDSQSNAPWTCGCLIAALGPGDRIGKQRGRKFPEGGKYDECDAAIVRSRSWRVGSNGYIRSRIGGKVCFLHRVIMNPPPGMVVDHINGDKSDNRRCNLRIVTPQENAVNREGTPARARLIAEMRDPSAAAISTAWGENNGG